MALIVQKYGGTSVADLQRIQNVANRVAKTYDQGNAVVVILSAMAGITDNLINMARNISQTPDKRELDVLLATGEQTTSALLAMTLKSMNYPAQSLLGHQAEVLTDQCHGNARILENLRLAGEHVAHSADAQTLWVRTPLIPGATATRENIAGIGAWLAMGLSRRHGHTSILNRYPLGVITAEDQGVLDNTSSDPTRRAPLVLSGYDFAAVWKTLGQAGDAAATESAAALFDAVRVIDERK